MIKYSVKTFDGALFFESTLFFSSNDQGIKLAYELGDMKIVVEETFPFIALAKIRVSLENIGLKILCNGSKLNVYPSGMALSSVKAYELEMGKPATKLLNIFDPISDPEEVASVADQKSFYENWIDTLKLNKPGGSGSK